MVALRKESVDRNYYCDHDTDWIRAVALRKESVDRNYAANAVDQILPGSLSARRAWIEIFRLRRLCTVQLSLSARRAWIEISGVDFAEDWLKSLSARRAWIEILVFARQVCVTCVALRKESVDRNSCWLLA